MSSTATLKAVLLGEDRSMSRTFDKVGGSAEGAGKKVEGKFGGGFAKMATKVAGVLGVVTLAQQGFSKLTDVLGESITAGSDFEQAIGAVDSVFKDDAKSIRKSAEEAAMGMGLSQNAYLEMATVLGAGLKNKGIEDFTGSTKDLITIGGDLAAQFGGPTKDAVDALASAMRGESDPIERYGISLNETAIKAKMAEMGLDGLEGAQLESAKTAARLALIQEQSADAMGANAREADTYAGSQARLAASWEDIKTQIGTALLPALTSLSQWFLQKGLPAVRDFGTWIRDDLWPVLKDGYNQIMPALRDAWDTITDAVGKGDGSWKDLGKTLTTQVIPFLTKLITVWLPLLATQWVIIINTIQTVWGAFQKLVQIGRNAISGLIDGLAALLRTWAGMLRGLSKIPGFGWAGTAANKLDNAADQASRLATNVRRIPSNKTLTITTRFLQVGNPSPGTLPGGIRAAYATGGPVMGGRSYLVGENGPELFTPERSGSITDARNTAKAIGGGSRSRGSGGGSEKPIIVQLMLDGRMVQEVLVDRKRALGGMPLGLA